MDADLILVDLVPADFAVIPPSPNLYSRQGLRSVGPTLKRWRRDATERRVAAERSIEIGQ
jgi:hypothetical protein